MSSQASTMDWLRLIKDVAPVAARLAKELAIAAGADKKAVKPLADFASRAQSVKSASDMLDRMSKKHEKESKEAAKINKPFKTCGGDVKCALMGETKLSSTGWRCILLGVNNTPESPACKKWAENR